MSIAGVNACRDRTTPKINGCSNGDGVIQGWARGSFVEAEADVEAEWSRQRRGKAEAEAESSRQRRGRLNSRQGRGEAERNRCCLCHFDIMHNAHVVVTCSCFVVNDIYQ